MTVVHQDTNNKFGQVGTTHHTTRSPAMVLFVKEAREVLVSPRGRLWLLML